MEYPLVEIIDRLLILKLKIEKSNNPRFTEEYEKYESVLEVYKSKGVKVKQKWLDKLYAINSSQWDLFSLMKIAKNNGPDLKEIGRIYIELLIENKKRTVVKNEIVDATGKGYKDIKIN